MRIRNLEFQNLDEVVERLNLLLDAGVERLARAALEQQCRVGAKACTRFQLWHCGHHLSFLTPRIEQPSVEPNSMEHTTSAQAAVARR